MIIEYHNQIKNAHAGLKIVHGRMVLCSVIIPPPSWYVNRDDCLLTTCRFFCYLLNIELTIVFAIELRKNSSFEFIKIDFKETHSDFYSNSNRSNPATSTSLSRIGITLLLQSCRELLHFERLIHIFSLQRRILKHRKHRLN